MEAGLPVGTARVKCEDKDYVTQSEWVTLTAGETTEVNFQLEPPLPVSPIVTGTVTDAGTAAPIAGAQVSVFDADTNWRGSDYTDPDGQYTIDENLPEGWARVKCELAGYVTQNLWVTLTLAETTVVNFQLQAQ